MANNNINFEIERKKSGEYEIAISISEGWSLKHYVNDWNLQRIIDKINDARGINSVMALFNCTEGQAAVLLKNWGELNGSSPFSFCSNCAFKRKECMKCSFVCQSPLERTLFLEFCNRGLKPELQKRICKDGSMYDYPEEINKDTILTIPDFYFENNHIKVCIYADGKTYHYNNEKQGIRDRGIDMALQNLGFKVLRFTGYQINNDVKGVVDSILKCME